MYPLDQIIRFNSATATTNGVNIRPDIWLFPFLNVYALFAKSKTSTAIDAGVWLPTDSSWKQVTNIKTKANFDGTTMGFGLTPTVGIRGYFLALDMNFSWTDIEELAKPAFAFVFGPRFGKNIPMKKKDMSLALWAGGFRVEIGSATSGSINATDILPVNEWQEKVSTGYTKVAENQQKVDNWWNGLSPTEQKNPANVAKHETANRVLGTFGNVLDQASQIVSNSGQGSVQYSLSKKQKQAWNFILGGQYQINRSWQIRAEYGFLGTRQQFIGGVQYRFNL
jgi:opacity protein-like surface antigen